MESNAWRTMLRRLYDAGFNVFPLAQEKRPAIRWSDLHNRRATPEELDTYCRLPAGGVGIVCGGPTELMVLDLDEMGAVDVVKPLVDRSVLSQCPWYPTRRGLHLWFRRPQRVPATLGKLSRDRVELLAYRHFAMCPPRASAETLRGPASLLGDRLRPENLPEVPESLLLWFGGGDKALCGGLDRAASLATFYLREGRDPIPEGQRNETLFRVACYMFRWRHEQTYEQTLVHLVNVAVEVDGLQRDEAIQCVDNAYVTVRPPKPGWEYEPWAGRGRETTDVAG